MDRKEIIEQLKQYFKLSELVCPHIIKRFGDTAWMFLSTQILHTLLVLRTDIINKPLIINHDNATQRGMRCNICPIVKQKTTAYESAHCNGMGFDITVVGMSAEDARKTIKEQCGKLPYPIRLEEDVTWLHVDCYDPCNDKVVNTFKA